MAAHGGGGPCAGGEHYGQPRLRGAEYRDIASSAWWQCRHEREGRERFVTLGHQEVGDGNLNLVFIVTGEAGAVIVKQALPYVRLVGESWPLPLKRSFFEYHALKRQGARDPGMVPEILFFDEAQAIIVMEFLTPHIILRRALIDGRELPKIGRDLGLFVARTLFRGPTFPW